MLSSMAWLKMPALLHDPGTFPPEGRGSLLLVGKPPGAHPSKRYDTVCTRNVIFGAMESDSVVISIMISRTKSTITIKVKKLRWPCLVGDSQTTRIGRIGHSHPREEAPKSGQA